MSVFRIIGAIAFLIVYLAVAAAFLVASWKYWPTDPEISILLLVTGLYACVCMGFLYKISHDA